MDASQFRELALESAHAYLQYLQNKDRGMSTIAVRAIRPTGNCFLLELNARIYLGEALERLIFEFNGSRYTQPDISPIEYDNEHATLLIKPAPRLYTEFSALRAHEILLLSDLKFLIHRVAGWYQSYGAFLALPARNADGMVPPVFYGDPSDAQSAAIRGALSSPFSYIWGAPGTGKTKRVLGSCVLSLLAAHKRVLLVAPTNNAVEQMLRGVLPILLASGYPIGEVLRLGTPSSSFASEYPGACEVHGLDAQLSSIDHSIDCIEKCLRFRDFCAHISAVSKELPPVFTRILSLMEDTRRLTNSQNECRSNTSMISARISLLREEIQQRTHDVDRCRRALTVASSRLRRFFFEAKRQLAISALQAAVQEVDNANAELSALVSKHESLLQESNALALSVKQNEDECARLIRDVHSIHSDWIPLQKRLSTLSLNSVEESIRSILRILSDGQALVEERLPIYAPYEQQSSQALSLQIAQLREQKESMQSGSAEERMKSVCVVAATIDKFFTIFSPDPNASFIPDHIFMDEAGYCALIKGAALLSLGAPVTFLGDHMQLPPVCEANDEDFSQPQNQSIFLWAQSVIFVEDIFRSSSTDMLYNYLLAEPAPFCALKKYDLNETYRFGASLSSVLASYVYTPAFRSVMPDGTDILVLDVPRVPGSTGRTNQGEVDAICQYLSSVPTEDYAILTPYKDQVKLLASALPHARKSERIFTIHASQGREWDTIFLSVCDTDNKWFTDTKRTNTKGKMIVNTAVSRSKLQLILVCDREYWMRQQDQLIGQLVRAGILLHAPKYKSRR